MDIGRLIACKAASLADHDAPSSTPAGFFYHEDEPGLFNLHAARRDAHSCSLTRWRDVLAPTFHDDAIQALPGTREDIDALLLLLSRLGYLFEIDLRQDPGHGWRQLSSLVQLQRGARQPLPAAQLSQLLEQLMLALCIEFEERQRFDWHGDTLVFRASDDGAIPLQDAAMRLHDAIHPRRRRDVDFLHTVRRYHCSVIDVLRAAQTIDDIALHPALQAHAPHAEHRNAHV